MCKACLCKLLLQLVDRPLETQEEGKSRIVGTGKKPAVQREKNGGGEYDSDLFDLLSRVLVLDRFVLAVVVGELGIIHIHMRGLVIWWRACIAQLFFILL